MPIFCLGTYTRLTRNPGLGLVSTEPPPSSTLVPGVPSTPLLTIGTGVGLPWNHQDIASTPNMTLSGVPAALLAGDCATTAAGRKALTRTAASLRIANIVVEIAWGLRL